MIDVSEIMSDPDFTKSITRRRATLAVANEGEATYTYADRCITAIVQPAKPSEVALLPEGSRLNKILSVWTACDLRAADGDATESDVLVIDGASFRVVKVEPWQTNGYVRVFAEGFIP